MENNTLFKLNGFDIETYSFCSTNLEPIKEWFISSGRDINGVKELQMISFEKNGYKALISFQIRDNTLVLIEQYEEFNTRHKNSFTIESNNIFDAIKELDCLRDECNYMFSPGLSQTKAVQLGEIFGFDIVIFSEVVT